MKLDTIDLRILDHLQRDGALSNVELARRVHLSPSPCLARVKALEAAGVPAAERPARLVMPKAANFARWNYLSWATPSRTMLQPRTSS